MTYSCLVDPNQGFIFGAVASWSERKSKDWQEIGWEVEGPALDVGEAAVVGLVDMEVELAAHAWIKKQMMWQVLLTPQL